MTFFDEREKKIDFQSLMFYSIAFAVQATRRWWITRQYRQSWDDIEITWNECLGRRRRKNHSQLCTHIWIYYKHSHYTFLRVRVLEKQRHKNELSMTYKKLISRWRRRRRSRGEHIKLPSKQNWQQHRLKESNVTAVFDVGWNTRLRHVWMGWSDHDARHSFWCEHTLERSRVGWVQSLLFLKFQQKKISQDEVNFVRIRTSSTIFLSHLLKFRNKVFFSLLNSSAIRPTWSKSVKFYFRSCVTASKRVRWLTDRVRTIFQIFHSSIP